MNDIAQRLLILHDSRKHAPQPGACGQTLGNESWRIVATGSQLMVMVEAAEEIERLSGAFSEGTNIDWKARAENVAGLYRIAVDERNTAEAYAGLKDQALRDIVALARTYSCPMSREQIIGLALAALAKNPAPTESSAASRSSGDDSSVAAGPQVENEIGIPKSTEGPGTQASSEGAVPSPSTHLLAIGTDFVMAPREPTHEMLYAAGVAPDSYDLEAEASARRGEPPYVYVARTIYKKMIAAAPSQVLSQGTRKDEP